MSSGELLVIAIVAVIVFGPDRLPALARRLGKLLRQIQQLREQAGRFWQAQLNEQQLLENQRKADEAERRQDVE
ncbi:Sec-independent protein translocase subunit TatA/TatB [Legionella sp. CNM-4043-24]|uniref:Sec-independent protein translocase subunit TatA/TatB n=1 Tax=Legionella sp. CNM-4043-24 TaxID=3421646 RepID=UPI00403AA2A5